MSSSLGFLASTTHLTASNPKFRTEIESECGEDLFFWSYLNLGAKFQHKMELLNLAKLHKNILPHRNLLNQGKINAYGHNQSNL